MREASKLLDEAGWKIDGGKRRNGKGELLEVEIWIFDPTLSVLGLYVENLRRLGLEASIRRVDAAQYERRMKSFDFDPDDAALRHVAHAGRRAQEFLAFGRRAAGRQLHLAGVADPVIDALTAKVMQANSRAELVAATRAIDRVLRAGTTGCRTGTRPRTTWRSGTSSRGRR